MTHIAAKLNGCMIEKNRGVALGHVFIRAKRESFMQSCIHAVMQSSSWCLCALVAKIFIKLCLARNRHVTAHNGHRMIYIPGKKTWIDKYEVSWAQFGNFLKEAKIPFGPASNDRFICSRGECPAVVTYEEAQKYCRAYGFMLPGAAEWEYAAGKGTSLYPWGNESPDQSGIWRANYDSLEGGVERDGFVGTAPVKSFEKFSSPFGIVNMSGNVWEWVQGNILKGGGFLSAKEDLRILSSKTGNNDRAGFRCIKLEK